MTTAPKNYLEEEQRTTALGYVPGCQRRLSNASKMAHVSSSCVSDRQKSTRAPAAASPRPRALPRDGGRCAALRRAACGRARRPPLQPTPPPKKEEWEKCWALPRRASKRRRLAPLRGAPRAQCAPYSQPPRRSASCKHEGRRAHSRPCSRERQCAAASCNVPLFDSSALARVSGSVSRATCVGGRSRGALTRPCRPPDAYVGFLRAPAGSLQDMAALCRSPLALRAPPALRAPSALARAVLCAALWALCAAALASARALPGHSGMIPVDGTKDGHIFYWYFPPREPAAADGGASPTPTPLVLWMTGGPGCSSELALFKVGLAPANPGTRAGCRPASWRQPACTLSVLLACRACIQRSAGAAGNRVGC